MDCLDSLAFRLRYIPFALPDPRKLIDIANIMAASDDMDQCVTFRMRDWKRINAFAWRGRNKAAGRRLESKAILWRQRRLDYASNVRRRKRWAEIKRLLGHPKTGA